MLIFRIVALSHHMIYFINKQERNKLLKVIKSSDELEEKRSRLVRLNESLEDKIERMEEKLMTERTLFVFFSSTVQRNIYQFLGTILDVGIATKIMTAK